MSKEVFLQETAPAATTDAAAPATTTPTETPTPKPPTEFNIGNGTCQLVSDDLSKFYDLKQMDAEKALTPSYSGNGQKGLYYTICQPAWDMTEEDFKLGDQKGYDKQNFPNKATAYWVDGGKPIYTFDGAKGIVKADNNGWDLTWTSKEQCTTDATKQFQIKL